MARVVRTYEPMTNVAESTKIVAPAATLFDMFALLWRVVYVCVRVCVIMFLVCCLEGTYSHAKGEASFKQINAAPLEPRVVALPEGILAHNDVGSCRIYRPAIR